MRSMTLLALCAALAACGEKEPSTDDSSTPASDSGGEADADGDGVPAGQDCDDADATAFPGATERCDGVDNDCDGQVDVGAVDAETYYVDADGDGYGDAGSGAPACAPDEGQVSAGGDCNDARDDVFPGATEVCDEVDNNCDGLIDEGEGATWYADLDRDGYGDDDNTQSACQAPGEDWIERGGDCDDSTSAASPGNTEEICDDGLDNDCDGAATGCTWSGQSHVEDEAWARIYGDRAGSYGGAALRALPDLQGDGQTWLLMSTAADQSDNVNVWLLDPSAVSGEQYADNVAAQGFRVRQSSAAYSLGSALDGGPDLTGSGTPDVAVADRYASASSDYGGVVWVATLGQDTRQRLDRDDGAWVQSDEDYAYLGADARLADDLTGDGVADLVMSATNAVNDRNQRSGIVYLVEGPFEDQVYSSDVRINLQGAGSYGGFGERLAAEDLTGDGVDDLVVASPQTAVGSTSSAGMVFVFAGPITANLTEGDEDAAVRGDANGGLLGQGMDVADVDGDGQLDLLLGAPTRPGARSSCGEAALFLGPFTGLREYVSAEATFLGVEPRAYTGLSVSAPGDLDGDGQVDVAVGAPLSAANGAESGLAYAVYGPHTGQITLGADAGFYADAGGTLGWAMAGGDFDGDGRADLALHQPSGSSSANTTSVASVWLLSSGGI